MLIFLRAGDDPGMPPGAGSPLCSVAYLDKVLPRWLELEPDNPYVAALVPLFIPRAVDLRVRAPQAWQVIRAAPVAPPIRAILERMLEFWLMERFPLLSNEDQLDGWLEGIFEAQSLEDLLGPRPRRGVPKAR